MTESIESLCKRALTYVDNPRTPRNDGCDYGGLDVPLDIRHFMSVFDGYTLAHWWHFGDVTQQGNLVSFGFLALGLGEHLVWTYDKRDGDVKLLAGGHILETYPSWTEAVADLLKHDFQHEWLLSHDNPARNNLPLFTATKCSSSQA